MKNLKLSNEIRLSDLVIILLLAIIWFSLYFKNHSQDYSKEFYDLNTKIDNLDKFLREPIETNFIIKDK